MGLLNKIRGWLPVTRRELDAVMDMMIDICDAVETADKQHSNIERSLISQLTQNGQETETKKDETTHVEFG